jgi:hypothetical protein
MGHIHLWRLGRVLAVAGTMLFVGIARPAAAQDESQPCDPNGQLIAYGDVRVGCTIEAAADVDIFTFQGTAGDQTAIILTRTSNVGSAVCAEVRGPGPTSPLLAGPTCNFNSLRFDVGPLASSGSHQIIVSEQFNDAIFNFNLSLTRMIPPHSPTPIAPGQVLTAQQLLPATDVDIFGFNAGIGDMLRVIATRTSNLGSAVCAEIRGPGNVVVQAQTCNFNTVDVMLPAATVAGTYHIVVTEQFNDAVFNYNLSLTCVSPTCLPTIPTCLVHPTFGGGTLTLDFAIGTPVPVNWSLTLLALGQAFPLWNIPLPVLPAPPVNFSLPIPSFPALGTIGFVSTFTAANSLTCADLKTVDTGPVSLGMTPDLLQQYLKPAQ